MYERTGFTLARVMVYRDRVSVAFPGGRIWRGLALLCGVFLLTACQPTQQGGAVKSTLKNDFGSGVSAVVDYASNEKTGKALLVVDVTNSTQRPIEVWFDHRLSRDGSQSMKRDRIYQGDAKFISRNFRLPLVQPGITETIKFEVSDNKGARLMETEPIINHVEIGGPQ